MPDVEHYARNLIGGQWQFPAAPYDFEIRNPDNSTVTAVVPLSSRFDVSEAIAAAQIALHESWADEKVRERLLHVLVSAIGANLEGLAHLQCTETGLSFADSLLAVEITAGLARSLVGSDTRDPVRSASGVSAHILSWGLPFTEVITSVLPCLIRGDTVVVKPSLRGPLTPIAFGLLATKVGLPPGVVNIVQGNGTDVGSELIRRRELTSLHVRAGERTIAQAERAHERSRVPLHTLRAGGNVMVVGLESEQDAAIIAGSVAAGVRIHSCGGPFGLSLLAVHREIAGPILAEVMGQLSDVVTAPLPAESLRKHALDRIAALGDAGAKVLLGGTGLPDDIEHRMGWSMPPTVLMLGTAGSPALLVEQASVPMGPVLGVITWTTRDELTSIFTASRAGQGIATTWGIADDAQFLPHGLVVSGATSSWPQAITRLPAAWIGGPQ
jgi:acyl-CoA reductase-like NAD-dependent aldehyde dehydrogenase